VGNEADACIMDLVGCLKGREAENNCEAGRRRREATMARFTNFGSGSECVNVGAITSSLVGVL